jgi:hypothetical protein
MPATDDFTFLNDAFTKREPQMRADILHSMNSPFPLKQSDADSISFYRDSQAVRHEVCEVSDPYPSVHVHDDILPMLNFVRPSMRNRSQDRT